MMHDFTFHSDPTLIASACSGSYGDGVSLDSLKDFHRRRVEVLAASGADLIAFETVPNKLEAKAYAELLEEEGVDIPAWFSFSCKDGANVVSGDPIEECAAIADSCEQVIAVGINCTAPRFVHQLIQSIQKVYTYITSIPMHMHKNSQIEFSCVKLQATNKPILIYPNSGETYDANTKEWVVSD